MEDWYDATVISNSILGSGFSIGDQVVFRRIVRDESSIFEIFNLKDTVRVLTGEDAKTQLRSSRDAKNNVIRSKDQGYIEWKYSSV